MNIQSLLVQNCDVSYKLLNIGLYKSSGSTYVQVHCDKHNLQYSNMFPLHEMDSAIKTFLDLKGKYDK